MSRSLAGFIAAGLTNKPGKALLAGFALSLGVSLLFISLGAAVAG